MGKLTNESFVLPRPGAWELEATHMQRPISRWLEPIFPAAMVRGFKEGSARYGALLSHMDVAAVNRFIYICPRPVGAPEKAKGPPPKFIFKLLTRLHPAIRSRLKRLAVVFETKAWREDVERWDREWKPAIEKRNAELYAVDPGALDVPALVAHLEDIEAWMDQAIYRHHSLNMCALLAVGDFLATAGAWTGAKPSELCRLLAGNSQVSVGATDQLIEAVAAIKASPSATAILAGTDSAQIVAQLKADPGVGAAVRAYVDVVGLRCPSSYDVAEPSTNELPDILVGTLRSGPAAKLDPAAIEVATGKLRETVPEEHRARFDELLVEARHVYRIRDERTYLNDAFAAGLARRALLAAGSKLALAGTLEAADHAVDLTGPELRALLRGEPGPSAKDVAAHVAFRLGHTVSDAPANLGFPPSGPPPAEWFPPAGARAMRAIGAVLAAMFDVAQQKNQLKKLVGLGASPGQYEGRARVVLGSEQFANVQQGDVLIARITCPSYNVLLPMLGGIVTDRGGLLSHAAIVAREYGMPAVVGTTDATTMIPDGARVRVDGGTGEVQVLS